MSRFEIEGGISLSGSIKPQGAKNEALQIIAATLLTDQLVKIFNIPEIEDTHCLIRMLELIGTNVSRKSHGEYHFQTKEFNKDYLLSNQFEEDASKIRGSVLLLAPLLIRLGEVRLPKLGGDRIGRRKVDTHLLALNQLGASFEFDHDKQAYLLKVDKLQCANLLLEEPSVTGTANTIMAAVFAKGQTTIYNAACEPYIQKLCQLLSQMGAKISGAGSNRIVVDGVSSLKGADHTVSSDFVEVGSLISLAAMTKSDISVTHIEEAWIEPVVRPFRKLGIKVEIKGDTLNVFGKEKYSIEDSLDGAIPAIADGPWPMTCPDLLSLILVAATQAEGSILIHQKMFESRLFFVDRLIDMGAKIILCDPHRATVIGINREYSLKAEQMSSPDIRAGVALLIASLSAEGKSTIHNIYQIDRGYEDIDKRLNALGAKIKRLD